MPRGQEEIQQILSEGLRILEQRPELWSYGIEEILDELDDNTEEMITNRWGAAAHTLVNSITDFRLSPLVSRLVDLHPDKGNALAFEYAGYLLQRDHGIVLESLLVEAHRQNCFDKVTDYAVRNLPFMTAVATEWTTPLLAALESCSQSYDAILRNYADGIAACDAFLQVMDLLGELKNQTQVDFVCVLFRNWADRNPASGKEALCCMGSHSTRWSKQAYIVAMDRFRCTIPEILPEQFPRIEQLFLEDNLLWQKGIPLLVNAIADNTVREPVRSQMLNYLQRLPDLPAEDRSIFLSALQWHRDIPDELLHLFGAVLACPFDENKCPLVLLDNIMYFLGKQQDWESVLKWMRVVFSVNKYHNSHTEFFHSFSLVAGVLKENIKAVMMVTLEDIASNEKDRVFFGVGLLTDLLPGEGLGISAECLEIRFTDIQLARMLRSILYLSVEGKKVCHAAYQLLSLIEEEPKAYLEAFWGDIHENYPGTLSRTAEFYRSSGSKLQREFAEQVISANEADQRLFEEACAVRDFRPSLEHRRIYTRGHHKWRNQINSQAREKSNFGGFFPAQVLKYGSKNAHIIKGRKGENYFQSSMYQHLEYSMEIPLLYTNNPVEFWWRKATLIQEMSCDETDS